MASNTSTKQSAGQEPKERSRSSAPSVNRVTLVGRLTADPELRYTAQGTACTRMSIATNDRSEPEFRACGACEGIADFAGKFLTKGRLVYLEGWLHGRTWRAEDGGTRRSVEVIVETLRALTPRPQEQQEVDVEQ